MVALPKEAHSCKSASLFLVFNDFVTKSIESIQKSVNFRWPSTKYGHVTLSVSVCSVQLHHVKPISLSMCTIMCYGYYDYTVPEENGAMDYSALMQNLKRNFLFGKMCTWFSKKLIHSIMTICHIITATLYCKSVTQCCVTLY